MFLFSKIFYSSNTFLLYLKLFLEKLAGFLAIVLNGYHIPSYYPPFSLSIYVRLIPRPIDIGEGLATWSDIFLLSLSRELRWLDGRERVLNAISLPRRGHTFVARGDCLALILKYCLG